MEARHGLAALSMTWVLHGRNCLGNTRLALPRGVVKHALLGTAEAGCPEGAVEGTEGSIFIGELGYIAIE